MATCAKILQVLPVKYKSNKSERFASLFHSRKDVDTQTQRGSTVVDHCPLLGMPGACVEIPQDKDL